MAEAYAHEYYDTEQRKHLSLVVEADGDLVIESPGDETPVHHPERGEITDRFHDYCRRHQINPRAVTTESRHDFASAVHAFVADDVTQYMREKTGKDGPPIGVLPRDMVEKKLALFYEQRDPAESDTVRRGLADRAQSQYLVLADSFQSRLKEVKGIRRLQTDFLQRGFYEAAGAMLDLKTAYGMTISVFRHKAALAGHTAVSHASSAES